jgi:hypothetical protein
VILGKEKGTDVLVQRNDDNQKSDSDDSSGSSDSSEDDEEHDPMGLNDLIEEGRKAAASSSSRRTTRAPPGDDEISFKSISNSNSSRSVMRCYKCHQEGHQMRDCPQRRATPAHMKRQSNT